MIKRHKIIAIFGLVVFLALDFYLEFGLPFLQNAKEVSQISAAASDHASWATSQTAPPAFPTGVPQNPAQVEAFEKQNLHYSPWPPKGDTATSLAPSKKQP